MFPSIGYHPMGGIIYKYFMNPHFGLRFGANYTSISASDSDSNIPVNRARNLSFGSRLFEMHGALEINFLPIEVNDFKVTPYVFGGLSAFYYNPFADDPNGSRVFLRPLSTEGQGLPIYPDRKQYSQINMAFPFGGGAKFFIGKTLMLTTELGFRYTNTDYLDDVSGTYADPRDIKAQRGDIAVALADRSGEPKIGLAGRQRGNGKKNDTYVMSGVSLIYYFGSIRCPNLQR
jgi:hypothetical protein